MTYSKNQTLHGNLWYSNDSSVVKIEDAVEDASDSNDLLNSIKKLNLLRKFSLDRER